MWTDSLGTLSVSANKTHRHAKQMYPTLLYYIASGEKVKVKKIFLQIRKLNLRHSICFMLAR